MVFESLIIILFAFAILIFATYKEDSISFFFSMILFVFGGLAIINNQVFNEGTNLGVGSVFIFFGVYIGVRTALEVITSSLNSFKMEGGNSKWKKK